MIYSCLENKTDAKYEILIFEHFHSPGYRGMIERGKRNISHKWRFLTNISHNVRFPRLYSDA